jgi:hypothetical protein
MPMSVCSVASVHAFDRSPKQCILPRQSIQLACYPLTTAPVYACLHNLLEILSADGRSMIVAEKITIFPPGNHFLRLALSCMDWEASSIIHPQSSGAYREADLSMTEIALCAEIRYLIDDAMISIDVNQELVQAMERLYQEYTQIIFSPASSSAPASTKKQQQQSKQLQQSSAKQPQPQLSKKEKKKASKHVAAAAAVECVEKKSRKPLTSLADLVEALDDDDVEINDEDLELFLENYEGEEDEDEEEDLCFDDLDLDDEEIQELLHRFTMTSLAAAEEEDEEEDLRPSIPTTARTSATSRAPTRGVSHVAIARPQIKKQQKQAKKKTSKADK